MKGIAVAILLALAGAGPSVAAEAASPAAASLHERLPEDEVIYFLLPDRFAKADPAKARPEGVGDRLKTGYDPTSAAFYNGGDLKGLIGKLDYIQSLGATALWIGPIFRNKPVQGPPGRESAGYHGYWILDFTDVDPHFGTREDFRRLVEAAHARGLKVYMDIVVNHTADVIRYRECPSGGCPYRSTGDYPVTRRGGAGGKAINDGFLGDDDHSPANFARLTRPDFAYTPYVPEGEEHAKTPDWLNDPIYYHNRGESAYHGESATYGDFAGLDDLYTENPRVVQGLIDIFGRWIDDFGVDGFRIDTARHVDSAFWRAFIPAMLARARARGVDHFHIFGEVADSDPGVLASYTREAAFPAVLDFAFRQTLIDVVAKGAPASRLERLFAIDADYADGAAGARRLPTFISSHDDGRFAHFVRQARPDAPDAEVRDRVILAYAMSFFLRGQPVIYYGDEQGFAGSGGYEAARQSMFASKVGAYNAETLVGTTATTAQDNYDPAHPIFRALSEMARLRGMEPALRRGAQVVRLADDGPGLFAVSRRLAGSTDEVVVVFNTDLKPHAAGLSVPAAARGFVALHGACPLSPFAPGAARFEAPPLSYLICKTTASPR